MTTPSLRELIVPGEGYIVPIDPKMDREPAGSLLLARAAAIRNAQHGALRQVIRELAPNLEEQAMSELAPRSSELVHDRMVVSETRTDPSDQGAHYRVELRVVLDLSALGAELARLAR